MDPNQDNKSAESVDQPNNATGRELTFGEKAVGITFNPGRNEKVERLKRSAADLIDAMNAEREAIKASEDDGQNGERIAMLTIAIRKVQEGQMWSVKSVTWMLP